MKRVLAVDPGEVRIGLAISDPTRTVARPLEVIAHTSRAGDAAEIVASARREDADTIVVGLAYDAEGGAGPQARRALRLVEALRAGGFAAVVTFDEFDSTRSALDLRPRDGLTDARAAAFILQAYLDAEKAT